MILRRRTVPAVLAALVALLVLTAAVHAQTADRALPLDEQVEKKVEQAVAFVSMEYQKPNSNRRYIESGSGFFVAPGYVITNHHVVAEGLQAASADLKIRIFSGTNDSRFFPAEVVKTDPQADLAMLHVIGDLPAIQPVQIDCNLPGKQTEVFGFGFPLGTMLDRSRLGPNVCLRRGYVSRMINDGTNIEADMNIDKGISGGPLVDENGMVRGVIKAMAGSEYNKAYAGISVASPVLLNFCQSVGVRVTLRDGTVTEPGTGTTMPTKVGMEPAPRPRAGFAEDVLRVFFTVGSALRLSALVPQMLVSENSAYTSDLRQTSRNHADLVIAGLKKTEAPEELVVRARELALLISQSQTEPKIVGEKATVLEQACDEWVTVAQAEEKLNYDLGAWLTELSLGLLDIKQGKDLRACAYFLREAEGQEAKDEIVSILKRLQSNLTSLKAKENEAIRREITRDADRLIGIGYLPTRNDGLNTLSKPSAPVTQSRSANNRIHVEF
ncbi:MAG: S1 family peptidase [Bacteroidota bacterium]